MRLSWFENRGSGRQRKVGAMVTAEREPITGVWGGAPTPAESRGRAPWSEGQGAKHP